MSKSLNWAMNFLNDFCLKDEKKNPNFMIIINIAYQII